MISNKVITNKVVTFWVCDVPWLMWCTEKLISFLKFTIFVEKEKWIFCRFVKGLLSLGVSTYIRLRLHTPVITEITLLAG